MPKYTLKFPDGTIITGFEWSFIGAYTKSFPDSGMHTAAINYLAFTHQAIAEHGIEIIKEESDPHA